MKNLFEAATVDAVKGRIMRLKPDSERQWGRMNSAQALAHCSIAIEMAMGKVYVKRILLGRLVGPMAKRSLIEKGEPMRRGAKTPKVCEVMDERDFATERQHLVEFINRFAKGGPEKCATYPHFFFGPLAPKEWSVLMYQHLDHHLRQFGA
ncbi:MAG: DUF1569 domain-containing protein [Silvibacterium sp.]